MSHQSNTMNIVKNTRIGTIIFVILQFSGHFSFSFDKKLNLFTKNHFYQYMSIFQSLFTIYIGIYSSAALLKPAFENNSQPVIRFDMVLSIFAVCFSCIIIAHEKLFCYESLISIFNETRNNFYGQFYNLIVDYSLRKGLIWIIMLFSLILPNIFTLVNAFTIFAQTAHANNNQMMVLNILILTMWIYMTILPFAILSWVTKNNLLALKMHIEVIWFKVHNGLKNDEIFEICNSLNDISICYNKIFTTTHNAAKHYSTHLIVNLLISFFSISYTTFLIVISVGRCMQVGFTLNWIDLIIRIMNLLYFISLVAIIVMLSDGVICQYDEIVYHLHNIQNDEIDSNLEKIVCISC